jgi:hypothetical protein
MVLKINKKYIIFIRIFLMLLFGQSFDSALLLIVIYEFCRFPLKDHVDLVNFSVLKSHGCAILHGFRQTALQLLVLLFE